MTVIIIGRAVVAAGEMVAVVGEIMVFQRSSNIIQPPTAAVVGDIQQAALGDTGIALSRPIHHHRHREGGC